MSNKKTIKGFIKYFRRLNKANFHGAVGFTKSESGEISNMEIAARYLRKKGINIQVNTTTTEDGGRLSEISLD